MGNERTATTATTKVAATAEAATTKMVNADAVTFVNNDDQQSMSTCQQQSLDELITESCNRMGIGDDRTDSNQIKSTADAKIGHAITEHHHQHDGAGAGANHAMLQFDCDSFILNDLAFCASESNSMDLANVIPSMSEIFPQSIEILNALYDDASNANNNDLQNFYINATIPNSMTISPPSSTPQPLPSPPPPLPLPPSPQQ